MMLSRKTLEVLESGKFKEHKTKVFDAYVSGLDEEDQARIKDSTRIELYCEFPLHVPVHPYHYGVEDLDFIHEEIKEPKPIATFRHITDFIKIMQSHELLDIEPMYPSEIGDSGTAISYKNGILFAFLERVTDALKTFPGKKEIARDAFVDFKKTWFDSLSSIRFAVRALTVSVDAVIISGNIVRVTFGNSPVAPLLLFEHVSIEFKGNWNVFRLGEHQRSRAETYVKNYLERSPVPTNFSERMNRVSEIFGVAKTRARSILMAANSPLAAYIAQITL